MATTKEELLVLGIKANGYYLRQVAVTYCGGTSVVRNFKFLTPFFVFLIIIINIILSTNCSYVILLCNTNSCFYYILLSLLNPAKFYQDYYLNYYIFYSFLT